ncbi:MAG: cytochrome c, partial [Paracoccaceae bacterium]|nr:cytochrome c [Paracoccaceae bacterium]
AACHRPEGNAFPPRIPALRGSENAGDLWIIVKNVREGQGLMPPFPTLSTEDIAAVASYVRTSWDNAYGPVTPEEVAALEAEFAPAGETRTIWDGVYTQAQADRGKAVFTSPCGLCHGSRLNGAPDDQDMVPAPPLARDKFLRVWNGRTLGALYSYTYNTMPQSNPAFLPEEDYLGIIAHMLATSGAPAGDTPLPLDVPVLAHILIVPQP